MTDPPAQNVVAPLGVIVGVAGVFTVSVAAFEFVLQPPAVTTARYCLPLSAVAAVNVSVVPVSPARFVQVPALFHCHWIVEPALATVNVAAVFAQTVVSDGCVVITGSGVTVTFVAALVAEHPVPSVTVTV